MAGIWSRLDRLETVAPALPVVIVWGGGLSQDAIDGAVAARSGGKPCAAYVLKWKGEE